MRERAVTKAFVPRQGDMTKWCLNQCTLSFLHVSDHLCRMGQVTRGLYFHLSARLGRPIMRSFSILPDSAKKRTKVVAFIQLSL